VLPAKPGPKPEPVTPKLVKSLVHTDRKSVVWMVKFSPDGSRLLFAGYPSGLVQLFDTGSWKEVRRFETQAGLRSSLMYAIPSPDMKTLYAPLPRRKAGRIEKDGKVEYRLEFHGEIKVWDLTTGEPRPSIPATPGHGPESGTLSPDGRYFAVSEHAPRQGREQAEDTLVLWDLQTRTSRKLPSGYGSVAFTPDGRHYVYAAFKTEPVSSRVSVYETSTGRMERQLIEEPGRLISWAIVSPDGKYAAAGSNDSKREKPSEVRLWEIASGADVGRFSLTGKSTVYSLDFVPDGSRLLAGNADGGFVVWDASGRKVADHREADKDRLKLLKVFSPDGRTMVLSSMARTGQERVREADPADLPQPRLHIVDVATGTERETLVLPNGVVGGVAFSPDGRWLAVGSYGAVQLLDLGKR
jgi:WD40 repeat protein